jgi:hypothetical protein
MTKSHAGRLNRLNLCGNTPRVNKCRCAPAGGNARQRAAETIFLQHPGDDRGHEADCGEERGIADEASVSHP